MSSPIYGPPAHNQLPGTNLLRDAFGKTLEVRRQITQMLLDRGRRGAAPGGRYAGVAVAASRGREIPACSAPGRLELPAV